MKSKLTYLILAIILITNIQCFGSKIKGNGNVVEEKRELNNFEKISVNDIIKIEITQSDIFEVKVKTDENIMEFVETAIKEDRLVISIKKNKNVKPTELVVYISLPVLSKLQVRGASIAKTTSKLSLQDFECEIGGASKANLEFDANILNLSMSGASELDLNVNSKNSEIKLSGASALDIKGKTDKLSSKLSGASNISGYEFISNEADIKTSGASKVRFTVNENISAHSSGASAIRIKGSPEKKDITKSGSAVIRFKE